MANADFSEKGTAGFGDPIVVFVTQQRDLVGALCIGAR